MDTREKNHYEQRFNCMVCLCPRLKMVYGKCQHKFCMDCLYDKDDSLRILSCPMCNQTDQFPATKPRIYEDNIEIQKILGIVECSNKGCSYEMWTWEQECHFSECPNRQQTTSKEKKTTQRKRTEGRSRPYLIRKAKRDSSNQS